MAVSNDLINLVLNKYYDNKDKQKSSASSSNEDKIDSKPESRKESKYIDYKKDSYSYKEKEAYEYPQYYDPYAHTAYVPPPTPGIIMRPRLLYSYEAPVRQPPSNPYDMLVRHRHPGPPGHLFPRHPLNYSPPHNPEYGYVDDSDSRHNLKRKYDHEDGERDMKRRFFEQRNTQVENEPEDFSYIYELYDHDKFPSILTDLFTSTTCNLCSITLYVPGRMELHYRGKNHMKRVKTWLFTNRQEHGLSVKEIENIGKLEDPEELEEDKKNTKLADEMNISFCKICNIQLSSAVVATQHYSGKKHKKALEQSKTHGKRSIERTEKSGSKVSTIEERASKWYCHLCKVASPTEDQYEFHLSGKRHKRVWKESQVVVPVGASLSMSSHMGFLEKSADMNLPEELEGEYDVNLYCVHCKEYFPTQPEFTYHSCSNTDEMICKKCNTEFDTRPELKYHDCPKDHYCEECDKCFDTPNDMVKHSCEGKASKPAESEINLLMSTFYCTLCKKELNSAVGLEAHGKSKLHRVLLFRLKKSQGISLDFNPFRTQARIRYHCEKCDINFKNEEDLAAHEKKGYHMIPLKPRQDIDSTMIESKPLRPKEIGAYDIRNVDVKALMRDYHKN